ncbi:Oxidoreductase (flavoprotein) [Methylophaga frappieri]|uniref:Oxidoreductase (Flavoprotein) n=1 Tax=Methylophaga frappieri (strain ATCC BAA-2434 / DSM 25690 / JAM7) TaxID=754477 RepID=I1YF58_METFJ|nr:FAD/NAD(P)-binding oxidoreductase [Methylophaga frappieri]AFJ01551.1 Oxidoreductase (flavoprotein) [Methylophaga frappieri]
MTAPKSHQIVIIGGGTAGTTVAASLLRKRPQLDVAVIEPSEVHYYQPAFTLVGGGTYSLSNTVKPQQATLPKQVTWIRQSATQIDPEQKQVHLLNDEIISYQYLVVATGIQLDWNKIDGLLETLGENGVCSNYSPQSVEYTWQCIDKFSGGKALFTQPPVPFKCAGAPQKIAYLAADQFHKRGLSKRTEINFYNAGGALFSVPDFIPYLEQTAARHDVNLNFNHNLIAVDGPNKKARFAVTDADGNSSEIEQDFDMLHVTPPQSAPEFIKQSRLVNEAGWVTVDQFTLQHTQFDDIFSLGDVSSLPTSKTAAAIRKQAPVLVQNLLSRLDGKPLDARYDGYTSCPVVTGYGKVMLAEFAYDAVVTPTLPLNPFKESRFYWFVKKYFLPPMYWHFMLKGFEADITHKPLKK